MASTISRILEEPGILPDHASAGLSYFLAETVTCGAGCLIEPDPWRFRPLVENQIRRARTFLNDQEEGWAIREE